MTYYKKIIQFLLLYWLCYPNTLRSHSQAPPVALFQRITPTQSQSTWDLHSSKTCLALNSIVMRHVYMFISFRPASTHLVNKRQVHQLSSQPRMQYFQFSKVFIKKKYSLSHRPVFFVGPLGKTKELCLQALHWFGQMNIALRDQEGRWEPYCCYIV